MLIRNCLLALFFSIFFISGAYAMRCGNKLVYEGDSEYDVLSKCGEPLSKQDYDQQSFNMIRRLSNWGNKWF